MESLILIAIIIYLAPLVVMLWVLFAITNGIKERLGKIERRKESYEERIDRQFAALKRRVDEFARRLDKMEAKAETFQTDAANDEIKQAPVYKQPGKASPEEKRQPERCETGQLPIEDVPIPPAAPPPSAVTNASEKASAYNGIVTTPPPSPAIPPSRPANTADKPENVSAANAGNGTIDQVVQHVITFFTSGNLVTKVGIIVLFFGFSFLLKYAAQRNMFPIELRLIAVFLCGLGLLGVGWWFREKRRGYGLLLQGGGIGILYLTVFAAARLYGVVPLPLAFAVMVCLAALMGILSVLQNAKSMAVAGIIGGFLAPILMSTGTGSHVMLFSYYAILNAGIFGIAWLRAWRELNLIGFVFTFGIGTYWGGNYYSPEYFASTEPFLVLFFLFYVSIAILFAIRKPFSPSAYVDGTLVFGTPLTAFGLQYCLVRDMEYGLAISAMVLGLFYIIVARTLWEMLGKRFRALAEAYLAFGVVFGSLAVPLALDGRWTSAVWALEGAAILWIGVRQERWAARVFGLILQGGAGFFFLSDTSYSIGAYPFANSIFTGCVLVSMAGLFSGWLTHAGKEKLQAWEKHLEILLVCWALLWWFGAGIHEIDRFIISHEYNGAANLMFTVFSLLALHFAGKRITWQILTYPAILLLPAMVLCWAAMLIRFDSFHLMRGVFVVVWPLSFAAHYFLLYENEKAWPRRLISAWHLISLWLVMATVTCECAYFAHLLEIARTWQHCCWGAVPALLVFLLVHFGDRIAWPVRRFAQDYYKKGTLVPLVAILIYAVALFLHEGDPSPLRYIPAFNPVEVVQLFILLTAITYVQRHGTLFPWYREPLNRWRLSLAPYGALFILLNTMVARTIHFYSGVPYSIERLGASFLFQTAISLLWGITALGTTVMATHKKSRPLWIVGAVILGLVVGKLFMVDLDGTSTIARIVSFLGVGALMLAIGYFSPMPPARAKENA